MSSTNGKSGDWEAILRFLLPKPPLYCPHTPTDKQIVFLRSEALEVLYGGRAGGGKSDALLMAALQYVDVPGYAAIIFRNTFSDLSLPGALMERAHDWLDGTDAHWNDARHTWTFPSHATLTFGYLEKPNDHLRYKGCVPGYTEVLTSTGWRRIDEIRRGDAVASMDPITRRMVFAPVTKTWRYDIDEDIVCSQPGADVSFEMTQNHNVWLTTNRVRDVLRKFQAIDMPMTARIPQWADWEGEEPPLEFRFAQYGKGGGARGDAVFDPYDFAEFLGWYIAEGSSGSSRYGALCISQHGDGQWVQRIGEMLTRAGIAWGRYDARNFSFSCAGLKKWLDKCGSGAKAKRIPREVLRYNAKFLQRLLDALVEGDGTWRDPDHRSGHFVTSSKQLADDVMEVAVRCGYRATLDERPYVPEHNHGLEGRSYHVSLHYRDRKDTIVGNNKKPFVLKRFKGPVYCLTVLPYHTFLVRHSGRIHWTGNSELQFCGFDEVTEIREKHYRYLFSRLRRPSGKNGLALARVPLRMRATSNPAPNWVRRRFIEEGQKHGRIYIPAGIDDNPYVDRESYERTLSELDEVDRARLARGDWYAEESGVKFQRSWFKIIGPEEVPADAFRDVVRYWDLAATTPHEGNLDPDWTAGAKVALHEGRIIVLDMRRWRRDPGDNETLIRQTAEEDGRAVRIRMEREPGSGGRNTISHYARNVLLGFDFDGHPAVVQKDKRADLWAGKAKRGEVLLVRGDWITAFLDEAVAFGATTAGHDDQIDAVSGAFEVLAKLGVKLRRRVEIVV